MSNKLLINNDIVFSELNYPLYHMGEMDISKKSNFSHEGNGLSVSICPLAWLNIINVSSSKVWKLDKKNIKLLDYYSIPKKSHKDIIQWGIKNNYLTKVKGRYIYKYYDDEFKQTIDILCNSFKEACLEACLENEYPTYEDYLKSKEAKDEVIVPTISYNPTQKLINTFLIEINKDNIKDMVLMLYLEKYTDYDGIYWRHELDTDILSAPCGVIFNSRLKFFNKKLVSLEGAYKIKNQLYEYEDEYED